YIIRSINWVDILAIALLARSIYLGLKDGLTAEIFKLTATLISIAVSLHFYGIIGKILSLRSPIPLWLCKFIVFCAIIFMVNIIFKYAVLLLLKILNIQFIPQLEKIGGALAGLVRGVLICGLTLIALLLINADYLERSIKERSFSAGFFLSAVGKTYKTAVNFIPGREPREYPF
ncbi:MAG TPA: CvpA family protein, partial [Candidatus Omnitrophica bacterium]|nr:CvpA family protein [Candidatus Omnitrophota bacterium]